MYQLATIDDGNDGIVDLVTTNLTEGSMSLFVGNDDGTFAERVQFTAGARAHGVAIEDLDGDSTEDVVITNMFDDTITVYLAE